MNSGGATGNNLLFNELGRASLPLLSQSGKLPLCDVESNRNHGLKSSMLTAIIQINHMGLS